MAAAASRDHMLEAHPHLEPEGLDAALAYATSQLDPAEELREASRPVRSALLKSTTKTWCPSATALSCVTW